MFENPLPVMDFEHTYIERKRFAPSRKSRAKRVCQKRTTGKDVFGHTGLSKLTKIKENATPIEESSFYVISLVRKSMLCLCMYVSFS